MNWVYLTLLVALTIVLRILFVRRLRWLQQEEEQEQQDHARINYRISEMDR